MILVEPQLGENIGTAARAMMNCGLSDLRLVDPRDGWPSEQALAASSGAEGILENARLYDSAAAALEGLHHVYATTARPRDMNKPVLGPREAGVAMRRAEAAGARNGILFGKESKGLHNDDVVAGRHDHRGPAQSGAHLAQPRPGRAAGRLGMVDSGVRGQRKSASPHSQPGRAEAPALQRRSAQHVRASRRRARRGRLFLSGGDAARSWCATCATSCTGRT